MHRTDAEGRAPARTFQDLDTSERLECILAACGLGAALLFAVAFLFVVLAGFSPV